MATVSLAGESDGLALSHSTLNFALFNHCTNAFWQFLIPAFRHPVHPVHPVSNSCRDSHQNIGQDLQDLQDKEFGPGRLGQFGLLNFVFRVQ